MTDAANLIYMEYSISGYNEL